MKKALKILSISIVSIILLAILIPVAITQFVDPNDYKAEISKLVDSAIIASGQEWTACLYTDQDWMTCANRRYFIYRRQPCLFGEAICIRHQ